MSKKKRELEKLKCTVRRRLGAETIEQLAHELKLDLATSSSWVMLASMAQW